MNAVARLPPGRRAPQQCYQPPVLRLLAAISQTRTSLVHKDRRRIHTLQNASETSAAAPWPNGLIYIGIYNIYN
jgi:hypothetical protein